MRLYSTGQPQINGQALPGAGFSIKRSQATRALEDGSFKETIACEMF